MFGLFGSRSVSPEARFWDWFGNNEKALHAMERADEALIDRLAAKLHAVNEDLTFEFGPVGADGQREFVVSAGGISASFPAVESLVDAAPDLDRWTWTKYRPRRAPLNNISLGGLEVSAEDVRYVMVKDDSKVGMLLFLPGYTEEQHDKFAQIGFLLLDESLGEFAVATQVGFIEFQGCGGDYFEQSSPLPELAAHFDGYCGRGTTH